MTTKAITPRGVFRAAVLGLWLLMGLMVVGANAPTAYAHAEYDRSMPAAESVIPAGPETVEVWFTQELFRREGANRLEVIAPDGSQVDLGDSRIDDDDRTHVIVSLQPDLPAGVYTVRWFNTSLEDGHAEEGEFVFTIDPSAPAANEEPTAVATATLVSVPTQAPESTELTESTEPTEALPLPTPTLTPSAETTNCFGGLILFPFLLGTLGMVSRLRKGQR
jgi:methionine-rich copper-binding protein CopC